MENGRIEPLRASPSLPPPTPVSQIDTMYIDFALDGNTPNPGLHFKPAPWNGS